MVSETYCVHKEAGEEKDKAEKGLNKAEKRGGPIAGLDKKPTKVEQRGAGLAQNKPGKHEGVETIMAGDDGDKCKGKMVKHSVQGADMGIKTHNVNEIG